MKRISSQLPSMDASYYMRLREWRMNDMQNKIASQSRIKDLRDDPLAAARSVRLQSEIFRTERFEHVARNLLLRERQVHRRPFSPLVHDGVPP